MGFSDPIDGEWAKFCEQTVAKASKGRFGKVLERMMHTHNILLFGFERGGGPLAINASARKE